MGMKRDKQKSLAAANKHTKKRLENEMWNRDREMVKNRKFEQVKYTTAKMVNHTPSKL